MNQRGNECRKNEGENPETANDLNKIQMEAMIKLYELSDSPWKEITDFALEQMVKITGSHLGYLSFLNREETLLTMYSWSKTAMHKCGIKKKPIVYEVETTGLWGEAIRQRKTIITNDYSAPNPWKKGCPQGHVTLKRHMNVPIFDGKHIVILAGVGNKKDEYTDVDGDQITILMNFLWSILKRKKVDESLHQSLAEKDVLLKEIHHRVKNNMQIISSLLALQTDFIEDNEAKVVMAETRSRVKSMAIIHEKLYKSDNFSKINISEYIQSLIDDMVTTFHVDLRGITLKLDLGNYFLKLDTAIPLGLIIHELFTNAFKHAFPDSDFGEIIISLKEDPINDKMIFYIKDNGIGFPQDLDPENVSTLGLQLVSSLVRQIDATMEMERDNGTEFIVTF